jgi:sarcosine oxidase subunit alpha
VIHQERGLSVSDPDSYEFTFNGRPITAKRNDTIASALVRAGVFVFSRSMKFHRPRGFYCGSGRCFSCVMRVNGVPGVRTCSTPAERGMVVESERGYPTTKHDAFSVFDHVFRRQFDYHSRFIRPVFMTPVYQSVIRRLASSSKVPDRAATFKPLERKECDVLIIGHGVSGSIARAGIQRASARTIIVDRGLGEHDSIASTAFGFFENGDVGIQSGQRIQLVKAKAVLLATGRAETGLPLVNGDLPGVMLPDAVHHLSIRGIRAGKRAVVVGTSGLVNRVVRDLGASGIDIVAKIEESASVVRVLGRDRVSGIEILDSGGARRKMGCDLVVSIGPLVPSVELAQQAGCLLEARGGFWQVKIDKTGRTTVPGVYACGGVTGLSSSEDRIASGQIASASIVESVGGS